MKLFFILLSTEPRAAAGSIPEYKKNGADLESCTQFLMRHVNSSFVSCILPKIEIDIC